MDDVQRAEMVCRWVTTVDEQGRRRLVARWEPATATAGPVAVPRHAA